MTGILEYLPSSLKEKTGMVFAGTMSQKYTADPMNNAGWGTLIDKFSLDVIDTVVLPAVWTFKESEDVYYIFSKLYQ
jgi:hypothetical protein